MVRWQVYVGGRQRGKDYDNERAAINAAISVATTFKQVYVYKTINGNGPIQVAKWVEGSRVG